MNKKLLLFTLLFMLFSVSFVNARMCDSQQVLDVLRKALYIYYTNPESSSFTADELKDLLSFYVGIQAGQVTIDCSAQSNNIDRANALPDTIPSCSDGTKYGKCSNSKPMYCYAGRLVPRCRLCGCPTGQWCDITYVYTEKGNKGQWGKCYPGTNITCAVNSDCGISNYIGDYYCNKDKDVYRNYTQYTCFNPGETDANCTRSDRIILIDDCQAGEQCVEGQAECQIIEQPPINQTCTDGTAYGQCSTTKPKYCSNGTLIDNCQVCGCETGTCQENDSCQQGYLAFVSHAIPTEHLKPDPSNPYPLYKSIYVIDLDDDGDRDILSAASQRSTDPYGPVYGPVVWFENDGSESFTEHFISTINGGVDDMSAGDLDGDGDNDILAVSWRGARIVWYENDGSESFTEHDIQSYGLNYWSIYAMDFDNDGDVDILAAGDDTSIYRDGNDQDDISLYINDGNANFVGSTIYAELDPQSYYTRYISAPGDIDGDGDLDFASTTWVSYSSMGTIRWIDWWENDGSGSFINNWIYPTQKIPIDSIIVDLDGDGDNDIFASFHVEPRQLNWYENTDGKGSFITEHKVLTETSTLHVFLAVDLDNDGDNDILIEPNNRWAENDGSGSFTIKYLLDINGQPCCGGARIAVDLDNDGDNDLLTTGAWHENLLI